MLQVKLWLKYDEFGFDTGLEFEFVRSVVLHHIVHSVEFLNKEDLTIRNHSETRAGSRMIKND